MFYNKAKKSAITRLKNAEIRFNTLGEEANEASIELYSVRKAAAAQISRVEKYINTLANTPKEFVKEVHEVQISIEEFHRAVEIERENSADNITGASAAAGGVVAGGAIAALGPTTAMAIATTFGTASTGTAISTLSGAAATNAALAWLGGGALTAGGGGMAAGNAILAMAGPIGWTVAGVLVVGGGTFAAWKNKKAAEEANSRAIEVERKYSELSTCIRKIKKLTVNTQKLKKSLGISLMVNTYPKDYNQFTLEQKETLASLINNVRSMGELINKRI